jgi:cation diffusion facilitator CzcD-associated flavoprotein CzcO
VSGKSFVVLETLESFGGTWLTHKYPGIRSDSDLYTFGYRFKPWVGPPIATAQEILSYMGEVIDENDLARHIRYRHRIDRRRWSSDDNLWTIEAERTDTGERLRFTANFLWMCQGYYRQPRATRPNGRAWTLQGPHRPPADLAGRPGLKGKKVVVIGSGATAATLLPGDRRDCGHVTLLQRSPTYFIPAATPTSWPTAARAEDRRDLDPRDRAPQDPARPGRLHPQAGSPRRGGQAGAAGRASAPSSAPESPRQHFTPTYRPWRQRLAFVPTGDIFQS